MAEPPTVTPHRITPSPSRPGCVLVSVVCPHCGRLHMHGGFTDDYAGHRTAGCLHPAGYVILPAAETKATR